MFLSSPMKHKLSIRSIQQQFRYLHSTQINEAARKGTREKARKKKVKIEIKKVGFIPHNERGKDKLNLLRKNKHIDDSWKQISTDNVWVGKYCRKLVYPFAEAVECHRETHHPTMYNEPNAQLNVQIQLNMQGEKITRFLDGFNRIAMIPHKFGQNDDRKILVIAKGEELLQQANAVGATLVGGTEIIKDIQTGRIDIEEYQYVVAHPNIMPELIAVRGLLKRKFPSPKNGSLGINVIGIIERFLNGIQYKCIKDEYQQNYAEINTTIGILSMDKNKLEENLAALLKDANSVRPKREGAFITKVLLTSPPSREVLQIDQYLYIPKEYVKPEKTDNVQDTEDLHTNEDDEEPSEKAAIN